MIPWWIFAGLFFLAPFGYMVYALVVGRSYRRMDPPPMERVQACFIVCWGITGILVILWGAGVL